MLNKLISTFGIATWIVLLLLALVVIVIVSIAIRITIALVTFVVTTVLPIIGVIALAVLGRWLFVKFWKKV